MGEQVTSDLVGEKTLVGFMTIERRSFVLTSPYQTNVLDTEPHIIKTCRLMAPAVCTKYATGHLCLTSNLLLARLQGGSLFAGLNHTSK